MDQWIRDTVVMVIDLDVVIDIDPGGFPFGKDEPIHGERFEDGFFQSFKEALSSGLKFFKGSVIEKL
jgi:hypothetical protein